MSATKYFFVPSSKQPHLDESSAQKLYVKKPPPGLFSSWDQLRGPVSITIACTVGMALAMADYYYFQDSSPFALKASGVVGTTLLLMDMSSAEKFYVTVTFRTIGTIGGIALGLMISFLEYYVEKSYKEPTDTENNDGVDKSKGFPNWHEEDWKLIVFRVSVICPIIFVATMMMKIFPKYSYPIVVFAVQTPKGLFSNDIKEAVGKALSGITAIIIAIVSIVSFENFSSESILLKTNSEAIQGVIAVMRMAIRGDVDQAVHFDETAETVHKSINTAESAISSYCQWRSLTCRETRRDFTILTQPIKPLFYSAFSMYWSNAKSFHATDYNSRFLFSDSETVYNTSFEPLLKKIDSALNGIQTILENLFSSRFHLEEKVEVTIVEKILNEHLHNGILVSQESLVNVYMEVRGENFKSFIQRWNFTDFLQQITLMSLALIEYVRGVATVFLDTDSDELTYVLGHLDSMVDSLDELRKKEASDGGSGILKPAIPEIPTRNTM